MRIGIISDSRIGRYNSALSQLDSLRDELVFLGNDVVFITQTDKLGFAIKSALYSRHQANIELFALETKMSISILRGIKEWLNPYLMILLWQVLLAKRFREPFDIIIWYSPSIFLSPFVNYLSANRPTKKILILRDIFPQWWKDIGGIKNGLVYRYLLTTANRQYVLADTICLQSHSDQIVFNSANTSIKKKLRILDNWLKVLPDNSILPFDRSSTIKPPDNYNDYIGSTEYYAEKNFLYSGNIGPAQKIELLIPFFRSLTSEDRINFKFYSYGPNESIVRETLTSEKNNHVSFYPPLPEFDLLQEDMKTDYGLLCLDLNLKNNNIPGKYLFYLRSGMPILALVNKNNDICNEITCNRIGVIVDSYDPEIIKKGITALIKLDKEDRLLRFRCRNLFQNKYSVAIAAKKILDFHLE